MEKQTTKDSNLDISIEKEISNGDLAISVTENGLFNSYATEKVTGLPYNIIFSSKDAPSTSFTTIKIDDINFVYGLIGKRIQKPTELPELKNESIYRYRNIEVKQTLQIIKDTFTNYDYTGMYKYTVTNNDTVSHKIGVRIMFDIMLKDNDGAPFIIPNVGTVTNEREFKNQDIPKEWQVYYSYDNPNISAKGTLTDGAAAKPDRFVIAAWPNIKVTSWDYEIDSSLSITKDSAVAIYWNTVVIKPGESREFATFYGPNTTEKVKKVEESNSKRNNTDKNTITRGINIFRF